MLADKCDDRQILRVTGVDKLSFLQGLVSNDVGKLEKGLMVYAALLTPQGKYLADFLLVPADDAILIDVQTDLAAGLMQRLLMYKLHAKIAIEPDDMPVFRGVGDVPLGGFADPRVPNLGWRYYGALEPEPLGLDWTSLHIANAVPLTGVELVPNDSFILEMGFERINGVDFRKGCYVGQEVTARMQHKTELRKGLAQVELDGTVAPGTEITANGKTVGTVHTNQDGHGMAYLRFDRVSDDMQADGVAVRRV